MLGIRSNSSGAAPLNLNLIAAEPQSNKRAVRTPQWTSRASDRACSLVLQWLCVRAYTCIACVRVVAYSSSRTTPAVVQPPAAACRLPRRLTEEARASRPGAALWMGHGPPQPKKNTPPLREHITRTSASSGDRRSGGLLCVGKPARNVSIAAGRARQRRAEMAPRSSSSSSPTGLDMLWPCAGVLSSHVPTRYSRLTKTTTLFQHLNSGPLLDRWWAAALAVDH